MKKLLLIMACVVISGCATTNYDEVVKDIRVEQDKIPLFTNTEEARKGFVACNGGQTPEERLGCAQGVAKLGAARITLNFGSYDSQKFEANLVITKSKYFEDWVKGLSSGPNGLHREVAEVVIDLEIKEIIIRSLVSNDRANDVVLKNYESRRDAAQAFSQGFNNSYRRDVNCTSTVNGSFVNTNCY